VTEIEIQKTRNNEQAKETYESVEDRLLQHQFLIKTQFGSMPDTDQLQSVMKSQGTDMAVTETKV
jgi:cell fate (sporulation/competence/biofilm development) regulator YlbF (YheA/YmcA/DUF963 family)